MESGGEAGCCGVVWPQSGGRGYGPSSESGTVLKGVAAQLEVLLTTCPPQWADGDAEALMGDMVDDAGNEWSQPPGKRQCPSS